MSDNATFAALARLEVGLAHLTGGLPTLAGLDALAGCLGRFRHGLQHRSAVLGRIETKLDNMRDSR
jgi:hypothetical protein